MALDEPDAGPLDSPDMETLFDPDLYGKGTTKRAKKEPPTPRTTHLPRWGFRLLQHRRSGPLVHRVPAETVGAAINGYAVMADCGKWGSPMTIDDFPDGMRYPMCDKCAQTL